MKSPVLTTCSAFSAWVAGLVIVATAEAAFVDGVVIDERVFNDIPDSVVTTVD